MPAAKPATTLVLLVRHGVTPTTGRLLPGRRRGLHLSDEGRRQAETLAARLAVVPKIAAIYSSPLERALETVAPLAKARGIAVRTERGLLEGDVGAWVGLSLRRAARRPEWSIVQRHASAFRFPEGDSAHRHRAGVDHGDRVSRGGAERAHDECDGWRSRITREAMTSFDFDVPDHFTVGTVGPQGERVFYIQGRQRGRLATLKSEKEQVRALATYLAQLLDKLPTASEATPQSLDLLEPVEAAWPVASLGLGWDEERQRIVVVAESVVEEEGDEPATARFAITRAQATAFVERAETLVKAGRAICPMCSQPKDPGGHVCPRSNGHVVR
ncbi:MAG: hypothetical protein DME02_07510 [Candidatus Rokuibacteriota bacterium]|nr:MAG: hypothetical protein DME02_07510 [Candidatus Rokubacteria bacterium]